MRVGSVLLMKGSWEREALPEGLHAGSRSAGTSIGSFSAGPVGLLDILGEPLLHRMVEVLRRGDVDVIYLVTDKGFAASPAVRSLERERIQVLSGADESLPALVETAVKRCAESGIRRVLLSEATA